MTKDFGHQSCRRKQDAKRAALDGLNAVKGAVMQKLLLDPRYKRDFGSVEPMLQDRPYLLWQEFADQDEDQLFERLTQSFIDDTLDDLEPGMGLRSENTLETTFNDPHWGNTTGHLTGQLEIDDLSTIHEDLQVGLFEREGSYPVFARANYLWDGSSDFKIAFNRLSLKLQTPFEVPNVYDPDGVGNELDILVSEGLPAGIPGQGDGQGFLFRDAWQLLTANEIKDGVWDVLQLMFNGTDWKSLLYWKNEIFPNAVDMIYREPHTRRHWDQKWYYSAGPFALGDGIMKFGLRPLLEDPGSSIPIDDNALHSHARRFKTLQDAKKRVRFDLMIQVATPGSVQAAGDDNPPACVMAAEYTDLVWDNEIAPFRRVGTLSLSPHQSDASDVSLGWHSAGFSAWNTLAENRPLGQLFRARRHVHTGHRAARIRHSFGGTASGASCPFG